MNFFYFTVEPSYERTSRIEKLRFSLMGQRHVCTFRHAQRAAYRTAISAAQIIVNIVVMCLKTVHSQLVQCTSCLFACLRQVGLYTAVTPSSDAGFYGHVGPLSRSAN